MPERVCPRCKTTPHPDDDVGAGDQSCGTCGARFPFIGDVSIFVLEPTFLARTYVETWRTWRDLATVATEVEGEILRGAGRPVLRRFADGTRANAALLRAHLDVLKPYVDSDELIVATEQKGELYAYTDGLVRYAARDWGGEHEHALEVGAIEAPLLAALDELPRARGSALVLGAGAGRFAWDLRGRFDAVEAVDLSWPMAATFERVRRGAVQIAEVSLLNVRSDDAAVRDVTLRLDHAATVETPGHVRTTIADAEALPFADASFDVCVAAFFFDALAPARLLREVERVLAPGGLFVSLGALNWNFRAPRAAKLGRVELLELLEQRGFVVERSELHPIDFLSGRGLAHLVYDATLVAARWTGATSTAALTAESSLVVEEGLQIVALPQTLAERARGEGALMRLQMLDGRDIQVDASLIELLVIAAAGGAVSDVHARAWTLGYEVDIETVIEACRVLVDAGALRIVKP